MDHHRVREEQEAYDESSAEDSDDDGSNSGSGSTDSDEGEEDGDSSESDEDEPVLKYKRFAKEVVSSGEGTLEGLKGHICCIAVHSKVRYTIITLGVY